ncbi:nucleotide sugar dehydrogenase [Dethiothermospora halolimnae]|uniref:nucleotide sugar dehydrogenase n=1 Tax=Dethiothermospora halolimnae TaxID=3114390 RepID=UPI003CCC3980
MDLYERIKKRQEKISVIGLGYVGMPLAVAFSKVTDVIGYDKSEKKILTYKQGIDGTKEVGDEALKKANIDFTTDDKKIKGAKFHIVAVQTPINKDKTPDLKYIIDASKTVGKNMSKGSIVVYESTVYPGVTEDVCIPVLERESGLKCGIDFKVGYSPERVNPGDKIHTLNKITKIVSGMDKEALDTIAKTYEMIIDAGVYRADTIKIAEAAKILENSQRDINIAFINEMAIIFNNMDIDTKEVIKAAKTKWNFIDFSPGLVGGHCICVDPYYLIFKSSEIGYNPMVLTGSRMINDYMGEFVTANIINKLKEKYKHINDLNVAIMGITFKENCPDIRNTRVIDIIKGLKDNGINIRVYDPVADYDETLDILNIKLCDLEDIKDMDALVFTVGHDDFNALTFEDIEAMYRDKEDKVLIDIKRIFNNKVAEKLGYIYWGL